MSPVNITFYRFAGKFGPFKVKMPCGECTLTHDIIEDVIKAELADIPTQFDTLDWLTVFWRPLLKGGWHAPIVFVEGKLLSQGNALNRGLLIQAIVTAYAKKTPLKGTHLFGKANCPHCSRAKALLEAKGIAFKYHDVIQSERALYEMLARVKPEIGEKTPVSVPQIWLEDQYVGGADTLEKLLSQ